MDEIKLESISLNPLKRIKLEDGDVLHALKSNDTEFKSFGEAYFSFVNYGKIKAWKLHKLMTLNLIVPIGEVKFVFTNNKSSEFREIIIGEESYKRITVPPGIIFGFQGKSKGANLLLNIADIQHDGAESIRFNLDFINYKW